MTTAVTTRSEEGIFSLSPTTLKEAMDLAKLIADSDLAPRDFKGKPGNVLIAVQMGAEVGLTPMAAIQTIAVINGRPSLWGDSGKAILLSHGCIIEEASAEQVRTSGIARCKITRPGRPPVERTFSRDDAKQAGLAGKEGPWKQYPERMLAWRAFWFAARDAAADLLKGLHGAEEVRDIPPEKDMGAVEVVAEAGKAAAAILAGGKPAEAPTVKPPRLDDVLKAIRAAETPEQMVAASEQCARLTVAAEKEIARKAYGDRLRELKAAAASAADPANGGLSYAEIADKINAATNTDQLNLARDLIRGVAAADQRDELTALAARRTDELAEGGGA